MGAPGSGRLHLSSARDPLSRGATASGPGPRGSRSGGPTGRDTAGSVALRAGIGSKLSSPALPDAVARELRPRDEAARGGRGGGGAAVSAKRPRRGSSSISPPFERSRRPTRWSSTPSPNEIWSSSDRRARAAAKEASSESSTARARQWERGSFEAGSFGRSFASRRSATAWTRSRSWRSRPSSAGRRASSSSRSSTSKGFSPASRSRPRAPREFIGLLSSLSRVPGLRALTADVRADLLSRARAELDPLEEVRADIETTLVSEPPRDFEGRGGYPRRCFSGARRDSRPPLPRARDARPDRDPGTPAHGDKLAQGPLQQGVRLLHRSHEIESRVRSRGLHPQADTGGLGEIRDARAQGVRGEDPECGGAHSNSRARYLFRT